MGRVEITVHQLALHTSDLRKLDDAHWRLLLLLGHAANEIAALYRAAHASGMDASRDADRFTWQVAQSQALLMLRLAGSKMYELFKITNSAEYSRMISAAYPEFPVVRRGIERQLGQHMKLHKYRNRFGFHYDAEVFRSVDASYLDSLPEGVAHEIVFERKGVNTFFGVSEVFFLKSFADEMKSKPSYEEFVTKVIPQLVWDFMVAINALIHAIHHVIMGICAANGIDLNAEDRRAQGTAPFTPSSEARLPAFILYPEATPRARSAAAEGR